MDSTPPATITSATPQAIWPAASAMACRPEEQKRLMVMPQTLSGRPARAATSRAMLKPCLRSGMAQPTMRSSI